MMIQNAGKAIILTMFAILLAGSVWLSAQMESEEGEDNTELIEAGRMLAELSDAAGGHGCINCHGTFGVGDLMIAPPYRGLTAEDVRNALENVEQMDFLEVSEDEIIALGAYLEWLGGFVPAKSELRADGFNPAEATVPVGAEIQVIIDNRERRAPHVVSSEDLGIEPTEIRARNADDFLWTAPEEPGTFTVLCDDCDEGAPSLTIIVEVPEESHEDESHEHGDDEEN